MSPFAQRFDSCSHTMHSQRFYLEIKGYYSDNGVIRWQPTAPVDVEPQKRFGAGAATSGEIDDYDWSDCEEF